MQARIQQIIEEKKAFQLTAQPEPQYQAPAPAAPTPPLPLNSCQSP